MTRDEAIRTMQNIAKDHDYRGAEYWTDVLWALGILKLDEPKSARDLAREVLRNQLIGQSYIGQHHIDNLLHVFDAAGLRIVEK